MLDESFETDLLDGALKGTLDMSDLWISSLLQLQRRGFTQCNSACVILPISYVKASIVDSFTVSFASAACRLKQIHSNFESDCLNQLTERAHFYLSEGNIHFLEASPIHPDSTQPLWRRNGQISASQPVD